MSSAGAGERQIRGMAAGDSVAIRGEARECDEGNTRADLEDAR